MNSSYQKIGIIDIGSNSIRLVIYEITPEGAHRIINEGKESARLSERIGSDGILARKDILSIVPILQRFKKLCELSGVDDIQAVATAAVRNAANSEEITTALSEKTGLTIRILSGEEEARFGFLGVINTMSITDGFIVDIGGGSTEISLFQSRKLLHSLSLPFGSVNMTKQFSKDGMVSDDSMHRLRSLIEDAIKPYDWICHNPGLPLIGLGGTSRNLGKLDQKRRKYSMQLAHNYRMSDGSLDLFMGLLSDLPLEKRKKMDGLSKDRVDLIVPGLIILHTIFRITNASECLVSGSGLRDGLFFEYIRPHEPLIPDIVEFSLLNLLMLHAPHTALHSSQVNAFAAILIDTLQSPVSSDVKEAVNIEIKERNEERKLLHIAARLYKIGVSVNYYQYNKHTLYLLAQSRINGLTHRELILCSLIASYKAKGRVHSLALTHKDVLQESDEALIVRLGTLLQLAIALDRSETQPVEQLTAHVHRKDLNLSLTCSQVPYVELRECESISKDFQKVWGLKLKLTVKAQADAFSNS
jgi:exopolyphosphatase/guanosine-5'-triphosphate,3'-diphosphate pyrophosphatase